MSEKNQEVDMSPIAIEMRLRKVSQLRNLGLKLKIAGQKKLEDKIVSDNEPMNEAEYIEQIKKTKLEIKKELIALPFEEKIRRVVEMQKLSKALKKDPNKEVYVWDIE